MLEKGFKQLLIKTITFLIVFITISFIIGKKIVGSRLLYGFDVFIYGGMGYILLFSIVGFILLYRERLFSIKEYKYKFADFIFVIISLLFVTIFYFIALNIQKVQESFLNTILIHFVFLSIFISLVLGVFGIPFIRNFIKEFKRELVYFLIFGIVAYALMVYVWRLWPYLSFVVLKIVYFMLNSTNADVEIIGNDILKVKTFAVKIGEACSGIYSIFLFSALYIFMILLDWKKIHKGRATLVFFPALLGAFFVNVFRVFSLMLIGGYVSREIALGLYHSYVGMFFFLIYFTIVILLFYNWIKKKEFKGENKLRGLYKKAISDPLYKNSIYLMLSTLVMAIFGFVFWMIVARLYKTEDIGITTTLISVMGLITSFSLLGLNTGLIRYLPTSENKNRKINSCFTLISLVTIIATTIFLLSLSFASPKLIFLKENLIVSFIFIFFMVFSSANSLIESIFISYRNTKFIFIKNTIFSVLKLALPFAFVSLGAYGIFTSWMLSLIAGFLVVLFILIFKFNYSPKFVFYDAVFKKIGKFSFGNYLAGFIGGLPLLLLPLIITNFLTPKTTAYYYISMMIASLLFAIPQATSNSLFAEGSYNNTNLKKQVWKAVKIISLLLIPGIILILLFGQYVLLLFGKDFSIYGYNFLKIVTISGIFVSINSIFASLFKVKHKIKEMIFVSFVSAIAILGLSFLMIDKGLLGISYAWLIGQILTNLAYFSISFFSK